MPVWCESRTSNNTSSRPSRKASITQAMASAAALEPVGDAYEPIRVTPSSGFAPTRQRFFKSIDAGVIQERRKARIDKNSISLPHSKSVSDLSLVLPTISQFPTRPKKASLSTWTSHQTVQDSYRSKSSLSQSRSHASIGFRGALRNMFSRNSEEAIEEPSYSYDDDMLRLSRQTSPMDVGGVVDSLNAVAADDYYRRPRYETASEPRFIPVRAAHDYLLGICFSDNIFESHLPGHIRVPLHHTSYGASPPDFSNLSSSAPRFSSSQYGISPTQTRTVQSESNSRPSKYDNRPSTAGAPPKGILLGSGSSPQDTWDFPKAYKSHQKTARIQKPGSPKRSPQRAKRDSLDITRIRSGGDGRVDGKSTSTSKALIKSVSNSTSVAKASSTVVPLPPPFSSYTAESSLHTAPRQAMESLGFAARISELEARMVSMEMSVHKLKIQQHEQNYHHHHLFVTSSQPQQQRGQVGSSNHQDGRQVPLLEGPVHPARASTSEGSRGDPSSRDMSPSDMESGSFPGSTWLLNDSAPSSPAHSAPHTPPPDGEVNNMPWMQENLPFVREGSMSTTGDDFGFLGAEAAQFKDSLDILRQELSLIRRYDIQSSQLDCLQSPLTPEEQSVRDSISPRLSRAMSASTIPQHALDAHAPDLHRLQRTRRPSSNHRRKESLRIFTSKPWTDGREQRDSLQKFEAVSASPSDVAELEGSDGIAHTSSAPELPGVLSNDNTAARQEDKDVQRAASAQGDFGSAASTSRAAPNRHAIRLQIPIPENNFAVTFNSHHKSNSNEWSNRGMDYTPLPSSDGGFHGITGYMNVPEHAVATSPRERELEHPSLQTSQQPLPGHTVFLRRFHSASTVPVHENEGGAEGLQELVRQPGSPAQVSTATAMSVNRLTVPQESEFRDGRPAGKPEHLEPPRSRFSFFDDTDDEDEDEDDEDDVEGEEEDEEEEGEEQRGSDATARGLAAAALEGHIKSHGRGTGASTGTGNGKGKVVYAGHQLRHYRIIDDNVDEGNDDEEEDGDEDVQRAGQDLVHTAVDMIAHPFDEQVVSPPPPEPADLAASGWPHVLSPPSPVSPVYTLPPPGQALRSGGRKE